MLCVPYTIPIASKLQSTRYRFLKGDNEETNDWEPELFASSFLVLYVQLI